MISFFIASVFTLAAAVDFDCSLCGIADCLACQRFDRWAEVNRRHESYILTGGYMYRKATWLENRNKIMTHNAGDNSTFSMSLNRFADLTSDEFSSQRLMSSIRVPDRQSLEPVRLDGVDPVNWLISGAVPPVLDQGQCGGCWAFSAYETLSAHYAIKFNSSAPALSPQELIDCVQSNYSCFGCQGGVPSRAMSYVLDRLNGGLERYRDYPYTGQNGQCNLSGLDRTVQVNASEVVNITSGSQRELLYVLANNGPVSVCIDASSSKFQFYSRGIYRDDNCSSVEVDHAVLLYGLYRDAQTGRWAYMVRNSWGQDTDGADNGWGVHGDIYMDAEYADGNMCGIATLASTVV